MKLKTLQVYSKPESMTQAQWEMEFLNPTAYAELKRRKLTDRQIVKYFGIRVHSMNEYKKLNPTYTKKERSA